MTVDGATTLADAFCFVLKTAPPATKAAAARSVARRWRSGDISEIGICAPPDRPARPDRPELRPPREMPRRGKTATDKGRIALLHALAHIELNAIDLACDIIARFSGQDLPRAFFDDWIKVADEEAQHFMLLRDRLGELGVTYGDLPAHDGLWEAAGNTFHDVLARLAVVPLVLEARGLDVTPAMIENLRRAQDLKSVAVLERIYADEIGHVGIGRRWFEWVAQQRALDPISTWHDLVRQNFKGMLKPPFNRAARDKAGLTAAYYEPLAASRTNAPYANQRASSPSATATRLVCPSEDRPTASTGDRSITGVPPSPSRRA